MTYREWLNERERWIEDWEKWNDDDEVDDIVVANGFDPTEGWVPIPCNMEIVRKRGQTELSVEQYEALGKYAKEAGWFCTGDEKEKEWRRMSFLEKGKIAYEWIQGCTEYRWLAVPFRPFSNPHGYYGSEEILYERMG